MPDSPLMNLLMSLYLEIVSAQQTYNIRGGSRVRLLHHKIPPYASCVEERPSQSGSSESYDAVIGNGPTLDIAYAL